MRHRVVPVALSFSVAAVALCGCGGETYYKRPETGQVAHVRFTAAGDLAFLVTQHASAECDLGSSGGIMGVVGGIDTGAPIPLGNVPPHVKQTGNTERMIGYGELSGARPIERAVAADREFVFTLHRLRDSRIQSGFLTKQFCTMTLRFTPRAAEQYEVTYSESRDGDATLCHARLSRLHLHGGGSVQRVPGPSLRRAARTCSPGAIQ